MEAHQLLPLKPLKNLEDYHQQKGDALTRARSMSSAEILDEIKAANLRGRGGAGFPTGKKWETLLNDRADKKFVVVNAAEGEPGTFKDRIIMRKNPYAMLEGMFIAAHFLQTKDLYIAIKGTFYQEMERIHEAISEFRASGLLQDLNVYLVAGPEDYLYGEEKALLNVIEGVGPLPREAHYPPYVIGLFSTPESSNPALVNNVETYARVPEIILRGAESFRNIGTESSPGRFVCTVCGDVQKEGVYEVPGGTLLSDIIHLMAGGPAEGRKIKMVLNGVSSAVLREEDLKVPLDYDEMAKIGSWPGSCSFIVYDDTRCAVRVAQEVALFLYDESCNQCTPCKTGTGVAYDSISALFTDNPDMTLIEKALNGAKSAPNENRCYLPVQASIVIPSIVHTFEQEFLAMLQSKGPFPEKVTLPMITDYDKKNHRFVLKGEELLVPPHHVWEEDENFMDRKAYTR